MRVVVTGGEGYIGSSLVAALLKEPRMKITTFDLFSAGHEIELPNAKHASKLRQIRGDISDPSSVKRALSKGVDVLVHLAAIPNPARCSADPERALRTNISGTDLILRESSRHHPLLIFASSQTVYGDTGRRRAKETLSPKPQDIYSSTKVAGETMVLSYHQAGLVRGVILRISSVYGMGASANLQQIPGRMVADCVVERVITLVSSENIRRPGGQIVDLVHVRDVCDAIIKVVKNRHKVGGEVLNISSGRGLPVREIAHIVAKTARRRRVANTIRYRRAYRPIWMIPRLVLSNAKARSMIGWEPQIRLEQGIEELFDYAEAKENNKLVGRR